MSIRHFDATLLTGVACGPVHGGQAAGTAGAAAEDQHGRRQPPHWQRAGHAGRAQQGGRGRAGGAAAAEGAAPAAAAGAAGRSMGCRLMLQPLSARAVAELQSDHFQHRIGIAAMLLWFRALRYLLIHFYDCNRHRLKG